MLIYLYYAKNELFPEDAISSFKNYIDVTTLVRVIQSAIFKENMRLIDRFVVHS